MPNKEIRILNVIPDERIGGPQNRVLQVARRLKEQGFMTVIAVPTGDSSFTAIAENGGIPCHQIKWFKRLPAGIRPISVLKWLFAFPPGMVSLVRLAREKRIDIVHANGSLSMQVPIAAKLAGCKLVWHLNDTLAPGALVRLLRPFLHWLPDQIVCTSKAVRDHYLGNGKLSRESEILYPPIDTTVFRPDDTSISEYRELFGIEPQTKVVGTFGNINPVKGIEYFLLAAKTVKESFPAVQFMVVGQKVSTREDYWLKLHELTRTLGLEGHVTFTGHRDDIPQMMNLMDVIITASTGESFSMVTAEAMACGKPVVATKVGGIPELVKEGETGILVPPANPGALSDGILHLLNHPETATKMGSMGRQRIVEKFDLTLCVQKHETIYRAIA